MVGMGKHGLVHAVFVYWCQLMLEMFVRPTHINELVAQDIDDVGSVHAPDSSVGRAWMNTSGEYSNIVWQVEWPIEINNLVVSDSNPTSIITNSHLEMAVILLQWLVLEEIHPTQHRLVLIRSNNTLLCSWAARISPI